MLEKHTSSSTDAVLEHLLNVQEQQTKAEAADVEGEEMVQSGTSNKPGKDHMEYKKHTLREQTSFKTQYLNILYECNDKKSFKTFCVQTVIWITTIIQSSVPCAIVNIS